MPPANKSSIAVGAVLAGKYRVSHEIGRGGMAAVYEASNVDIGKRVAVKVLNAELTSSAVVVERFLREARAAAAVNSPYICDVYDAGRLDDGRPFLVLELLEGESLYERMVKVRRFDPPTVSRIFTQVCRGLTKAHEANIIHRDLKPENIFLTTGDDDQLVAKILDFGLAKFYAPVEETEAQQRLTREGAIFGTPAYMSPEQVRGQGQVDLRADLWALGCMVYEVLVGRTVWSTEQGVAMIFAQIATSPLPVPSLKRAELPLGFDAWFFRALARNPDDRFQTAKEFGDELAAALGQGSPSMIFPQTLSELEREILSSPQSSSRPIRATPSVIGNAQTERPGPTDLEFGEEAPTVKLHLPSISETATSSSIEQRELGQQLPKPAAKKRAFLGASVGFLSVVGMGVFAWYLLKGPPVRPTVPAMPSASTVASSSASAASPQAVPLTPPADQPKWASSVAQAQELVAKGDVPGAMAAFKESFEGNTSPVPRVLLEHLQIAVANKGRCKVNGIGRPRPYGLTSLTRRPDIATTDRGVLVTWSDDHETAGQFHAYTVLLDRALRPLTKPIDVSPEGVNVQEPRLLTLGDQAIVLYSDTQVARPGVFARLLDASGRIVAEPIKLSESRTASMSPSMTKGPSGEIWFAYAEDTGKDSSDIFFSRYSSALKVLSPSARLTELLDKKEKASPRARGPSIGFTAKAAMLVFRLEQSRDRVAVRQRFALSDPLFATGLKSDPAVRPSKDQSVGELSALTDKGRKAGFPTIACDETSCFAVWREEPKGVAASYLDPATGAALWSKRFAPRATQVSVAVDGHGAGMVSFYESGRIRLAPITRDGIGEAINFGRVTGEQASPSVTFSGQTGEWLISWSDYEAGHLEAFVGRVACQ